LVDLETTKLYFISESLAFGLIQLEERILYVSLHLPHVVHMVLSRETLDHDFVKVDTSAKL